MKKKVNNYPIQNQSHIDDYTCCHTDISKKNWDLYFLELTKLISTKSKDRSTKVGAVIVGEDNEILSTGYNGFPRGINDDVDKRHERPAKYQWTEHAERNAIYNASRVGIRLKGSRLYLNTNAIPCTDCARAIIQSGIISVIGPNSKFAGKGKQWEDDLKVSKEMLDESGITVYEISKEGYNCG